MTPVVAFTLPEENDVSRTASKVTFSVNCPWWGLVGQVTDNPVFEEVKRLLRAKSVRGKLTKPTTG